MICYKYKGFLDLVWRWVGGYVVFYNKVCILDNKIGFLVLMLFLGNLMFYGFFRVRRLLVVCKLS